MPLTMQIETQAEQQGLTLMGLQRTSRRASRELALHRTEQALDQSTTAIEASRKRPPHLSAYSAQGPRLLSALGGDHALRPEVAPDEVLFLAVELGVGQNRADAR
jgi:hypothetical protein